MSAIKSARNGGRAAPVRVVTTARRALWASGWPARVLLLSMVGAYRLTLGKLAGGRCRFHPSCSAYAEGAIRELGAVRGAALAVWRILRCSPLTSGGIDHPPRGRAPKYDAVIHRASSAPSRAKPEVAA